MRIDVLTVMPEMLEPFFNCSILKRAQDKGLVEIVIHNLRDYTTNKHRKVDDYPFGGEAGMVISLLMPAYPHLRRNAIMTRSSSLRLMVRLSTSRWPTVCRCSIM